MVDDRSLLAVLREDFGMHLAQERLRAAGFVRLLHAADRRQAAACLAR